jgi:hypothetical protein
MRRRTPSISSLSLSAALEIPHSGTHNTSERFEKFPVHLHHKFLDSKWTQPGLPRRRALAERSGDGPARRDRTEKAKKSTYSFPCAESREEWVGSGVLAKGTQRTGLKERASRTSSNSLETARVALYSMAGRACFTPISRECRGGTRPGRARGRRESQRSCNMNRITGFRRVRLRSGLRSESRPSAAADPAWGPLRVGRRRGGAPACGLLGTGPCPVSTPTCG